MGALVEFLGQGLLSIAYAVGQFLGMKGLSDPKKRGKRGREE